MPAVEEAAAVAALSGSAVNAKTAACVALVTGAAAVAAPVAGGIAAVIAACGALLAAPVVS